MDFRQRQSSSIVLGVDIGGTGMKAAPVLISEGRLKSSPAKVATPTPPVPESVFSMINDLIAHFEWHGDVGYGFPGVVKNGVVFTAPNLSREWEGVTFREKVQRFSPGDVAVINDADAAALAEMQFGAGRKHNGPMGGVVMVLTFGTGIGSALFVDGHLVPNLELGHIEMEGIEAEKEAAAVVREREKLSWEEWGGRVNRFLQAMDVLFSPDLFIIGGGVSENWEKFFPFLSARSNIAPAEMGNNAGIVGAAIAVRSMGIRKAL